MTLVPGNDSRCLLWVSCVSVSMSVGENGRILAVNRHWTWDNWEGDMNIRWLVRLSFFCCYFAGQLLIHYCFIVFICIVNRSKNRTAFCFTLIRRKNVNCQWMETFNSVPLESPKGQANTFPWPQQRCVSLYPHAGQPGIQLLRGHGQTQEALGGEIECYVLIKHSQQCPLQALHGRQTTCSSVVLNYSCSITSCCTWELITVIYFVSLHVYLCFSVSACVPVWQECMKYYCCRG